MLQALILTLVVHALAGCGCSEKWLTVSEVWQNADSLEGKRICVRGQQDGQQSLCVSRRGISP
jgi:hypothetical protein